MTAVYLLRHPETTWNAAQRYQGRLESPLSAQGRRQVRLLAGALTGQRFDVIYTSPLLRARSLSQELARTTGSPLCIDQRLTEMAQGVWEGLYVDEIQLRYARLHERWYRAPDRVRFPGGENLQEVRLRALSLLSHVYATYPDGHVAVVTHSVVIQTIVAAAMNLSLKNIHAIQISNASITTLCGTEAPGSILTLNALESLHRSPLESASAHDCVSWSQRRIAS
ncbi:MAG: alpha-ribazole phosphatase [Chloroflexota bacterium]